MFHRSVFAHNLKKQILFSDSHQRLTIICTIVYLQQHDLITLTSTGPKQQLSYSIKIPNHFITKIAHCSTLEESEDAGILASGCVLLLKPHFIKTNNSYNIPQLARRLEMYDYNLLLLMQPPPVHGWLQIISILPLSGSPPPPPPPPLQNTALNTHPHPGPCQLILTQFGPVS